MLYINIIFKAMGLFCKEDLITKEYLESKGFKLIIGKNGVSYKLKLVVDYGHGYLTHNSYYYYFPKTQCDVENILHEISMLEVNYFDKQYRTINDSFVLNNPKTQFDMDMIIQQCFDIVKKKCKQATKISVEKYQ